MQSFCGNDGFFSVFHEQHPKKHMEDIRGKYGDTMEFHHKTLKTQHRVENYCEFLTFFSLSMKPVAGFEKMSTKKCFEGRTI